MTDRAEQFGEPHALELTDRFADSKKPRPLFCLASLSTISLLRQP